MVRAREIPGADSSLGVARRLGRPGAIREGGSWPGDPRAQLRVATGSLRPTALRSVADFSLYLAATQATPTKRRIGFTIDG